jgi:type IV pilus assembly protein PilA
MFYKAQGFTLIELLIVVIIAGILVALGLPSYTKIKEQALDREAKVNLKLIQAAEKIYRIEVGGYYPSGDIANLNLYLKLEIPSGAGRNWNYGATGTGDLSATPTSGTMRTWSLPMGVEDPTCSGC